MAHEITDVDQMFYVGEVPWHGLGVELPSLATAAEAIEAANLGWTVKTVPLFIKDDNYVSVDDDFAIFDSKPSSGEYKDISDNLSKVAVVRSDTGEALGIVSPKYQPIQNHDGFAFMDAVTCDPNGPKYVTAGSLMRGRRVWALLKLPDFIEVTKDDIVEEYLLCSTSHDGTLMFNAMFTPIRVVCNNTLSMALTKYRGDNTVRIRHLGDVRNKITTAQDILGISIQNHHSLKELVNYLVDTEPTNEQVETVMVNLFKTEDKKDATSILDLAPQSQTAIEEIISLANTGKGNKEVAGTAWALYNGVTEYTDWSRRVGGTKVDAQDRKVYSNWFGGGANFKDKALNLIKEVCKIPA